VRRGTYEAGGEALLAWALAADIEIHDIGAPIGDIGITSMLQRHAVIQHGRLAAADVALHLSRARYGALKYAVDCVAKSSVFGAYCGNGVCPIVFSERYPESDGLVADRHYFAGLRAAERLSDLVQPVAAAAWAWYQPHRISSHVETLLRFTAGARG
jgi:hypothetical protein